MVTLSRSNPRDSQMPRKPPRHLARPVVLAAAMALLGPLVPSAGAALAAGAAPAQRSIAPAQQAHASNKAPARLDNIWGGFDHQPTKSEVESAEQASKVAPTAQEQSREAQIVEQLNRQLLASAGAAP